MVNIQASVSKGWLHREMGICFDQEYYFDPLHRQKQDMETAVFLDDRFSRYRIHNLESNLVNLDHYTPRQIMVGAIQPNLIIGMLLGADFIAYPDQDADISEKPLAGLDKITDLPPAKALLEMPLIRRFHTELEQFMRSNPSTGKDDPVIPPFFWDTGRRAIIHGSLTSALKFFGHELLLKMYDEPQFITDFFIWYEDACRALIYDFAQAAQISPLSLHVGECSGTIVGPDDYARFVAPSLQRLKHSIAPVRLHHCGNCTHLLPIIAKEAGIASLDTGEGTDVATVRSLFGPAMHLDLMPPVTLLMEGEGAEPLLHWLTQVLQENQGGNLSINYHLEPGYHKENHLLLHEHLYELGLLSPGRK
jgi:hypothetical protein